MNAPAPLDPEVIRRDFPLFEREFHGRRLAYLDSAATALKPRVVAEAVDGYNRRYSANVHRGIYTIGEEATAAYEGAREKVARFINAPSAREVVFVRNATEAINLVAYAWGTAQHRPRRRHRADRAGAPLQPGALAAAGAGEGRRPRVRALRRPRDG